MSSTTPTESTAKRTSPQPSAERGNVRGQATRLRILSEAERLFAERGLSAVPLRDIGQAAGQRNHAAVQYHFGDREEVVKAIMEYRGAESEIKRTDMVTTLMMSGNTPTVSDVVSAFVQPLAIHFRPDNHYLGFFSLFITEEGGYEGLVGVRAGASVITLQTLLGKLVPQIPEAVLTERWWTALTSAVHTLARYQSAQRKRDRLPANIEVLTADLIAFLSAGLVAPVVSGDPRK